MDTCHGEKYSSQGRNVVDADAAANHRLIVRKGPIGKTDTRSEISVSLAQLFRPPRLLRGQEGSAVTRAGTGIDIIWCVTGVDGLCPQRLRRRQGPGIRGDNHPARARNGGIEVSEVNGIVSLLSG